MAPLPVISDCVRVAFRWHNSTFARPAINVMHFKSAGSDPNALYTKIDAHVTQAMWGHTTTGSVIDQLTLTPLDGTSLSVVKSITPALKWGGTAASSEITPQVAAIVKLLTDERGRSKRGRVFLPWCAESQIANGQLNTAQVTSMQSAWNAFASAMFADLFPIVIASYKLASMAVVTSQLVETQLGTVRLRQPR